MSYKYSVTSLSELNTCDYRLIKLFTEAIKYMDIRIIYGHRGKTVQNALYDAGRSQVQFPDSKHNSMPSKGIDACPHPCDWEALDKGDLKEWGRFYAFVGFIRALAVKMDIPLRCGADWDGDFNLKDQQFDDLAHFEIKE